MIVNPGKFWHKINQIYCKKKDYFYQDDPDLTFQEFVLLEKMRLHALDKEYDLDDLNNSNDDLLLVLNWKTMCVANLFQPIIIDKPWDKVLRKKSELKKNAIYDEKGLLINWDKREPYKTLFEEKKKKEPSIYGLPEGDK